MPGKDDAVTQCFFAQDGDIPMRTLVNRAIARQARIVKRYLTVHRTGNFQL